MKYTAVITARPKADGQLWVGVFELRGDETPNGTMPHFRKIMENEKDTQAEVLANTLIYYGEHLEKLLAAVGVKPELKIQTWGGTK